METRVYSINFQIQLPQRLPSSSLEYHTDFGVKKYYAWWNIVTNNSQLACFYMLLY